MFSQQTHGQGSQVSRRTVRHTGGSQPADIARSRRIQKPQSIALEMLPGCYGFPISRQRTEQDSFCFAEPTAQRAGGTVVTPVWWVRTWPSWWHGQKQGTPDPARRTRKRETAVQTGVRGKEGRLAAPPPKCIKLPSSEGWLMKQYKSSGRIRESAG